MKKLRPALLWKEGRSSEILGHAVAWWVNVSGIETWSASDYEMTWIYSWTWIVSRSESGCGSGNEMNGSVTWRTLRSESWSQTKTSLGCESDSWSGCLHDHCYVSPDPFSFWLSS